MFYAENMQKLRIFCSKVNLKAVIEELYKAKAIDVISHAKDDTLDIGTPLDESKDISAALIRARKILYRFNINDPKNIPKNLDKEKILKQIDLINDIDEKSTELFDKQKDITEDINLKVELKKQITAISKLGIGLDLFKETSSLSYFLGTVTDFDILNIALNHELKSGFEIFNAKYANKTVVAIFVEKSKAESVQDILRNTTFSELKIPEEVKENNVLEKLTTEIANLRTELREVNKSITEIKTKNGKDVAIFEKVFSDMSKKADSPLMFAETKHVTIITGWVPESKVKKIKKELKNVTSNDVHIESLEMKKGDDVPIKLDNPEGVNAYEFLLRMFSMPSYKELDPSIFMFITFPLFFGFMLGDIGYGLVCLLLFSFLKKKMPEGKDLFNIMRFSAIASIIFGCIFGEVFGFEIAAMLHPPVEGAEVVHHVASFPEWVTTYPWHRNAANAINLITISAIIGFIHVNLGLLLGFINIYRAHGLKEAIYEKLGWVVLELGVAAIALGQLGIVPWLDLWDGLIIILIAGIMIYRGEGTQGLVELPSVFIHIGSYLRLMAIGLASVGLAVVINEQTMPLFQKGPLFVIMGIVIFVVGHIINIALGIIGPFLHSLRLHYVEYFTKFYSGGGKEYSPFGVKQDNEI